MRINFVLTWKKAVGLAVLGLVAALAFSFSGLVSIAASSGHVAPWRWFLGWTLDNAVRTQSALVDKPAGLDLGDPALVQRAAGHFATGCAACHGAPGVRQSPVVLGMTPVPPRLEDKVGHWKDHELFWIVKHGIKYSGMPAWPAQARDDEVWAQVAFLRALPGMTPQAYADLALGGGLGDDNTEAGGQTTAALNGIVANALGDCARCHGRDGLGRGQGAFPVIAGQPEAYLYATLRAFGLGMRQSGFMAPPASRYSPQVLGELARHFASQPVQTAAPTATESEPPEPPIAAPGRKDLLALGRRLALEGLPARKIPSCQGCHSRAGQAKNPFYPHLAGQPEWYLAEHLKLWKKGKRGGTVYASVMQKISEQMTDEQIAAAAAWYAEQPAAAR